MLRSDNPIAAEAPSTLIRISKVGVRTILAPSVPLSIKNVKEMTAVILDCIQRPNSEIILDCKSAKFMDSAGLELLLQVHNDLKNNGGKLKVIGLNETCRDILYATRLINVFNIFNDIHDAIRHKP
ncbi:hypothetical protein JY97_02855 [Alkalispirochaeta odontotermitis]|nr:hypothetical protein JY97_02855 [Alkalispirochaeta odontotermitis]CAB1083168.1 hypothetical protein D1AOALGA4SA_10748 [Olavius algarvensis Delta 1 endosymbiont]